MLQSVKDSSLAEWDSKHLLLLSPLLWLASYTPVCISRDLPHGTRATVSSGRKDSSVNASEGLG